MTDGRQERLPKTNGTDCRPDHEVMGSRNQLEKAEERNVNNKEKEKKAYGLNFIEREGGEIEDDDETSSSNGDQHERERTAVSNVRPQINSPLMGEEPHIQRPLVESEKVAGTKKAEKIPQTKINNYEGFIIRNDRPEQIVNEYATIENNVLRVMTINVRSDLKWNLQSLITEIERNQAKVCLVTETGMDKDWLLSVPAKKVLKDRKLKALPAMTKNNKAGHIAFVIDENIALREIEHYELTGRIITISIQTNDNAVDDIKCTRIYRGFDKEENEELMKIIKDIVEEKDEKRIILGDINEIGGTLDYSANYANQKPRNQGKFYKKIIENGYHDVHREANPYDQLHTFVKKNKKGLNYSRLDYVFVSEELADQVVQCKIETVPFFKTDHLPIWLDITSIPLNSAPETTEIKLA